MATKKKGSFRCVCACVSAEEKEEVSRSGGGGGVNKICAEGEISATDISEPQDVLKFNLKCGGKAPYDWLPFVNSVFP